MQDSEHELPPQSLRDAWMALQPDIKALLPERNFSHLERTNAMHCGKGEGGSKFDDPCVHTVIDVIGMRKDLPEKVAAREDDRVALMAKGVPERAFLPATKTGAHRADLPEALYYIVDGVEGRLGVVKIDDVPPGTRILVRREKGVADKANVSEYAAVSLTALCGSEADMPKTDFATVIVGRESDGVNEVWTVHPGAPIRPMLREYAFSEGLPGPNEVPAGVKQPVRILTIEQLREADVLSEKDYIKIHPGNVDDLASTYDILP